MTLWNPLIVVAVLFALLGLAFLVMTMVALKRGTFFGTAMKFVVASLMISLSALFGTISIAIQGYQSLTREELAATVSIEPVGEQKFIARISLPDGTEKKFSLAGDQFYIDAHILKWKPLANIFGLHTSYELDRVAGRYMALNDETSKVHTAYSLSADKPVNMFDLRRRFEFLNPLLDAEYGSATFINANSTEKLKVMVSTTGLLIRKSEEGSAQ